MFIQHLITQCAEHGQVGNLDEHQKIALEHYHIYIKLI